MQFQDWIMHLGSIKGNVSNKEYISNLEEMLKQFMDDQKMHLNQEYIAYWIKYAGNCEDTYEVLTYLEENSIGTIFFMLYESLAIYLEKNHRFMESLRYLQKAEQVKAEPYHNIQKSIKSLYRRMVQRTERDFMNKKENLSGQKRSIIEFQDQTKIQKILKNIDGLNSCVKIGNIDVYIDKEYRDNICGDECEKVIQNYETLCNKYLFQKKMDPQNIKPYSFLKQNTAKNYLNINLKNINSIPKTEDQQTDNFFLILQEFQSQQKDQLSPFTKKLIQNIQINPPISEKQSESEQKKSIQQQLFFIHKSQINELERFPMFAQFKNKIINFESQNHYHDISPQNSEKKKDNIQKPLIT